MKYWTKEEIFHRFERPVKTFRSEIMTLSLVYLDEDELKQD